MLVFMQEQMLVDFDLRLRILTWELGEEGSQKEKKENT